MAQQVVIAGALFNDVPSISVPDSNSVWHPFVDPSVTTAAASDVASGKQFIAADGTLTTGTASGGGGTSNWKLIGSGEFDVNTTSTSNISVGNVSCTSEMWTSDKIIWVHIKDKAGKRTSHFYSSDAIFINVRPINGQSVTDQASYIARIVIRVSSSNQYEAYVGATGYGVFAYSIDGNNSRVVINARYNSSNSRTINGTYTVEVYALSVPTGKTIFE